MILLSKIGNITFFLSPVKRKMPERQRELGKSIFTKAKKHMERVQIESRIFQILGYINHPIIPALRENLDLFSLKELLLVLEFLETGDLNPIQQFFTQKIQEYKAILENIKMKKAFQKLEHHKISENEERAQEMEDAEDMITFE